MLILLSVAEGVCLCLIGSSKQKYQKQSKQARILQVICVQCVVCSGIDECGPQQHLNWPNCNLQICLHAVYSAAALSSIPTSAVHFRSSGEMFVCLLVQQQAACSCRFRSRLRRKANVGCFSCVCGYFHDAIWFGCMETSSPSTWNRALKIFQWTNPNEGGVIIKQKNKI